MLYQQKMTESVQDKVREEFAKTSGADAEAAGFLAAETAFLGYLKAKVDQLNAAQQTEKIILEDL